MMRLLTIVALSFCSLIYAAEEIKNTARIETDKVVEDTMESQLESRLSKGVASYLNHNRFVISVDLDIVTERTDTLVPIEKSTSISSPRTNKITTTESSSGSATTSSARTQNTATSSQPSMVLPGLPLSGRQNASSGNPEPEEEIITKVVEESTETEENKQEQSYVALAPHVVNKIDKMRISVILDDTTSEEDQRFVKDLLIERSQFNRVRGDEIDITLSRFVQPTVSEAGISGLTLASLPWWIWASLLLALVIILVLILRRPKQAAPTPAPKIIPTTEKSEEKNTSQKAKNLDSVIERFVSVAVASPEEVTTYFKGNAQDPNQQTMLSAIYETVPSGVFRALFPNLTQEQRMALIEKQATTPLEDGQKYAMLTALLDMIDSQPKSQAEEEQDDKLAPFRFLNKLDNNQILYVINDEPVKIQALAISQLPGDAAADILKKLPDAKRKGVLVALSDISEFPLDAMRFIAERLARKAVDAPSFANVHADGIHILSGVLDAMSEMEAQASLESLKQDNPELYLRIKEVYLTFEDLDRVPELKLGDILSQLERNDLAHALIHAPEALSSYIMNAMPNKVRLAVKEEMQALKGNANKEIEKNTRLALLQKVRSAVRSGQIVLLEKESATQNNG